MFETTKGYVGANPLGLWRLTFVSYTPEAFVEPGGDQTVVVLPGDPVDLAIDDPVTLEDEAAGISKGGPEDLVTHRRRAPPCLRLPSRESARRRRL